MVWWDINNWYKSMELVSQIIQIEDPSRLVSSAHGDLPSKDALKIASSINVWGMNVYRWDEPASIFEEWKKLSNKPMYFAEIGADSFMTKSTSKYDKGENQQAQADANKKIISDVLNNSDKNIGSFVFQFTDGYGKQEIQVNKILVGQPQIAMEHHMTALRMKSTGA
jgi:hypothetical protein